MMFSLDVLRARKGDCMLLHFGTKKDRRLVLIDGGPRNVYKPHLKPRIEEIRKGRKLTREQVLFIDLLMVSHVDDDHIQGILDLTKELISAQDDQQPPAVKFGKLWHNSFDDIIDKPSEKITAAVTASFGQAATSAGLPDDATVDAEESEDVIAANLKVLASIPQGFRLRTDAKKLEIPLNPEIGGKLIIAREDGESVKVAPALTFKIIGPMPAEIEALRKKHNEWLRKLEKEGQSAEDALAAYVDKSVTNLSSIVVLAECSNKTMLLTGDARGDKILEGLELTGVVKEGAGLHVNLLKVPHHGSANNLERDFFKRVIADHYVFSGNGEHGNPEREALEMLLEARADAQYQLHFTYRIDEIDVERKKDWQKEQAKERKKGKEARSNWSPKKHSLAALFAANPEFSKKLRFVDVREPHIIDLADSF